MKFESEDINDWKLHCMALGRKIERLQHELILQVAENNKLTEHIELYKKSKKSYEDMLKEIKG